MILSTQSIDIYFSSCLQRRGFLLWSSLSSLFFPFFLITKKTTMISLFNKTTKKGWLRYKISNPIKHFKLNKQWNAYQNKVHWIPFKITSLFFNMTPILCSTFFQRFCPLFLSECFLFTFDSTAQRNFNFEKYWLFIASFNSRNDNNNIELGCHNCKFQNSYSAQFLKYNTLIWLESNTYEL